MSVADIFLPSGKIAPFFLPSSAPSDIVASPLQIKSPDDTKTGTIAQNNNGNMVMYADPAGELYLGEGAVFFSSPDGSEEASITVANTGDTTLSAGRTLILAATSNAVQIAGNGVLETEGVIFHDSGCEVTYGTNDLELVSEAGIVNVTDKTNTGQVYDTHFNPVYSITVLNNNTTGNIAYNNIASRPAGIYQLQLSIEGAAPTNSTFLFMGCNAPPSSQEINFSGISINAAAVSPQQDICLNTGYFTHAGGNLEINVGTTIVPIVNPTPGPQPGTPWTGTWSLQLVKIG